MFIKYESITREEGGRERTGARSERRYNLLLICCLGLLRIHAVSDQQVLLHYILLVV